MVTFNKSKTYLSILVMLSFAIMASFGVGSALADNPTQGTYTATPAAKQVVHGIVINKSGNSVDIKVYSSDVNGTDTSTTYSNITPNNFAKENYNIGSDVYFLLDNGIPVTSKMSTKPFDPNIGFSSSLFGIYCESNVAMTCWIQHVYDWAQGALFLLSVGAVIFAGIYWMYSAGDPNKITFAKKLLKGAATAIGVIVLGRLFLTNVVGVPWL